MNIKKLTAANLMLILSIVRCSSGQTVNEIYNNNANSETNSHTHLTNHLQLVNGIDAPKYYDLNALLYKKTSFGASGNPQQPIRPKDAVGPDEFDGEDELAVDELIKSIRRKSSDGKDRVDGSRESDSRDTETRLVDDDEATIQRKSTNIGLDRADSDSDQLSTLEGGTSSRLRGTDARSRHRRERRASTRQAPPRLKSRRMSRNSRRRIRHKPKRRA